METLTSSELSAVESLPLLLLFFMLLFADLLLSCSGRVWVRGLERLHSPPQPRAKGYTCVLSHTNSRGGWRGYHGNMCRTTGRAWKPVQVNSCLSHTSDIMESIQSEWRECPFSGRCQDKTERRDIHQNGPPTFISILFLSCSRLNHRM